MGLKSLIYRVYIHIYMGVYISFCFPAASAWQMSTNRLPPQNKTQGSSQTKAARHSKIVLLQIFRLTIDGERVSERARGRGRECVCEREQASWLVRDYTCLSSASLSKSYGTLSLEKKTSKTKNFIKPKKKFFFWSRVQMSTTTNRFVQNWLVFFFLDCVGIFSLLSLSQLKVFYLCFSLRFTVKLTAHSLCPLIGAYCFSWYLTWFVFLPRPGGPSRNVLIIDNFAALPPHSTYLTTWYMRLNMQIYTDIDISEIFKLIL